MVYQTKVRMQQDATFGAFDCPDAGQIAAEARPRRTTPLQALNLLNSPFVAAAGRRSSPTRLRREAGDDAAAQVRRGVPAGVRPRAGRRGDAPRRASWSRTHGLPTLLPGAVQRERVPVRALTGPGRQPTERVSPMADPTLSDAGRAPARTAAAFLAHAGTGLGGIALASLLADEGLLAAERTDADPPGHPPGRPARARGRRTSRRRRSASSSSSAPARAATSTRGTTSPS